VIPAGEAGHVADLTDHRGGDDGAGAEDLGHGGARGLDRSRELVLGVSHLRAGPAQVVKECGGELAAGRLHRS
jgi:hypothetical protein